MIDCDESDLDPVSMAEAGEANGIAHFRMPHVRTPLEELIAAEEEQSEDQMRARQEVFRRLLEFFLDGTQMRPERIAMRVLVVVKAVAPELLASENRAGGVETSMEEIGAALGRTRASVSYHLRRLSDRTSEQLGKTVVFPSQRTDETRAANRLAALGNDSKRTGMKRRAAASLVAAESQG